MKSNRCIESRKRHNGQWEDLDMVLSEKGKKYQTYQLWKKKKSQGDIDLTHTTLLHRCVMERQYEESEYFVHGWNIISNWHIVPRDYANFSMIPEKHYLEELQI